MNETYLLIGGNLGNRQERMQEAVQLIATLGKLVRLSSVYETEAWGINDQPAFLNQVVLLQTELPAIKLMQSILLIEEQMGRKRKEKFGPRIIDIDILFYNEDIVESADLVIPHPQLHLRRFTLEPMNEIAPGLIHPLFNKSISELLAECPDPLAVKKL
jgi:2-amino-4-hydroxy-6-hydroxymethyldihydropteridine diphosphokinase